MRPLNVLILPKELKGRVEISSKIMVRLDFMAYEHVDQDAYYVEKNRYNGQVGYIDGPVFREMIHKSHPLYIKDEYK